MISSVSLSRLKVEGSRVYGSEFKELAGLRLRVLRCSNSLAPQQERCTVFSCLRLGFVGWVLNALQEIVPAFGVLLMARSPRKSLALCRPRPKTS